VPRLIRCAKCEPHLLCRQQKLANRFPNVSSNWNLEARKHFPLRYLDSQSFFHHVRLRGLDFVRRRWKRTVSDIQANHFCSYLTMILASIRTSMTGLSTTICNMQSVMSLLVMSTISTSHHRLNRQVCSRMTGTTKTASSNLTSPRSGQRWNLEMLFQI